MERLRPVSRRAPLLAVAVVFALVMSGCAGNGPVGRSAAAEVDGRDISAQSIRDTVDAQRAYLEISGASAEKQRAAAVEAGEPAISAEELAANVDSQIATFSGAGNATFPTASAANALTSLIDLRLLEKAVADAGTRVTDEQRDAARNTVQEDLDQIGLALDDVPQVLVDNAVEQTALQAALRASAPPELTAQNQTSEEDYTAQLRQIYEAQVGQLEQLCIKVIQTTDEATATQARTRVEDGGDFTEVATELSVDAGQGAAGGPESCFGSDQIASILGEGALSAEAGDLLGPGEAPDGSFLVVQVDSVQTPTFEDVRPDIEAANPNTSGQEAVDAALQQYVDEILGRVAAEADVRIDPRYGTWDPEARAVVAPADPGAARPSPPELDGATPSGSPEP